MDEGWLLDGFLVPSVSAFVAGLGRLGDGFRDYVRQQIDAGVLVGDYVSATLQVPLRFTSPCGAKINVMQDVR